VEDKQPYDPSKDVRNVSGSPYLQVKYQIKWFRDLHPGGDIVTTLHTLTDDQAVFKAEVSIPDDVDTESGTVISRGGSATGWGSETRQDFRDYIEKAETKALGRALRALGFATPETDFGDDPTSAEAPRSQSRNAQPANRPAPTRTEQPAQKSAPAQPAPARNEQSGAATDGQLKAIMDLASRIGWSKQDLVDDLGSIGLNLETINFKEAGDYLRDVQARTRAAR
jgi:hypothetical protein